MARKKKRLGELLLEACDNPTEASTIVIIPGIMAITPTQGITASTNVIIPVISAAIPRFCPAFDLTSSMIQIIIFIFHSWSGYLTYPALKT